MWGRPSSPPRRLPKQALRPRTKNDSRAFGGDYITVMQPSNPTDTQTLGCLRRSGSLCYVNLTMRGSRTCTSCATPGFFLYKRKFLFFELEFRFTTAVFCLTHFCMAWQTLLQRHQPRRGKQAPPSQAHHYPVLSLMMYTCKSKLKTQTAVETRPSERRVLAAQ